MTLNNNKKWDRKINELILNIIQLNVKIKRFTLVSILNSWNLSIYIN